MSASYHMEIYTICCINIFANLFWFIALSSTTLSQSNIFLSYSYFPLQPHVPTLLPSSVLLLLACDNSLFEYIGHCSIWKCYIYISISITWMMFATLTFCVKTKFYKISVFYYIMPFNAEFFCFLSCVCKFKKILSNDLTY